MIATAGHLLTLVAFLIAVAGSIAAFVAHRGENRALASWARLASFAVAGLVLIAVLLMEFALITHDFSVKYVYDVGSRSSPLFITIISLWGALEGSILFWALLLSLYTVAFTLTYRRRLDILEGPVTGVLLAISAFFLLVIVGPGNPFVPVSPTPADGQGLNPLLQNHWMMGVHPVLLYLGYVGLSVPFAVTTAALVAGSPSPTTLRIIRRWALIPFVFLSLGIVAGMWWSYAVLGWGGYWSWDPVENASVMPWLVTTAFLHSLQVQERRGMLKTWTLSLVISAFLLSILGTFLTRSGVLESVHSFTQSSVGPVFLGFFACVLVASLALLLMRSRDLEAPGALEASVCRETAFMFNNLFLVTITFTILLGTLFPLISEAFQGSLVSVGGPYFNHVAVPIGIALLFLMGVGPVLPWGAARFEDLQYRLLGPTAVGTGTVFVLLFLGVRGVGALVTFGLSAFVLSVTLARYVTDVRARRRGTGEPAWLALRRLFSANPRRYGGYLVHLGVLLIVVGIAASQAYEVRASATLHRGQSLSVDGYRLRFLGYRAHPESNRMVFGVAVDVRRDSDYMGTYVPSENIYSNNGQTVPTPAVREEPLDMILGLLKGTNPVPDLAQLTQGQNPFEDVYIVLEAYNPVHNNILDPRSTVSLQVLINPLVGLIWFGGIVVGLGGVVALVPARRRRRATSAAPEKARPVPQIEEVRA